MHLKTKGFFLVVVFKIGNSEKEKAYIHKIHPTQIYNQIIFDSFGFLSRNI